ncbi:MAG: glycosyl hydrolase family 65 protein [Armatimonadota bacterium]|nr:glycosyl hydrolase family 65 protein [Armatimonadota bacterium]
MILSRNTKILCGIAVVALAVICLAFLVTPNGRRRQKRVFDPWVMTSTSPTDSYGTYLGNGYIGVRLGNDGWASMDGRPLRSYLSGLYDGETLVSIPASPRFIIEDMGHRRYEIDKNLPYRQSLDMRRGFLRTQYSMRRGRDLIHRDRNVIDLDISFYVSRVRRGIIVVTLSITPHRDVSLRIRPHLAGASELIPDSQWAVKTGTLEKSVDSIEARKTKDRRSRVAVLAKLECPPSIHRMARNEGFTATMESYQKRTCVYYVSVARTDRFGVPVAQALAAMKSARAIGAAALIAEHKAAWRKLWTSDIKIEGDPEAQQVVHSCMFYLLQSVRKGNDWSVPPTGLSAAAWSGHVFWDADTWMFPALLPQHPELAKQIIDYRYKTLTGARANARGRDLSGVEFAWESARTGRETIAKAYSEERHITADVALAQWQYYLATGDRRWLRRRAYPILAETAGYWVSRARYNRSADRYEIPRVVPPDEIAEIVDNSVYTNAAARRNLEIAIEARRRLGRAHPYAWGVVARKMYLPFDRKNRRYIEYAGYSGGKTKQADTELLIYPLGLPMPPDVAARTFDYYKSKVDPRGPAMTSSVHAVIAARMGRKDEAYAHFLKSYRPYLRGPFNLFNEKPSRHIDNTCFLTGAAGTLQAVIYGFGGLDTSSRRLKAAPNLPKRWKKLAVTGIKWRGRTYDLIVEPTGYRLRKASAAINSRKSPKIRRKTASLH